MSKHYKDDLEIDINSLDHEWEKQPVLYMQHAEELAEANRERDTQKQKLEIVTAELSKAARTDPDIAVEIGKLTENSIHNWIVTQEEYQEAQNNLNEASYEAAILASMVRALEQRKSALENLVKLSLAGYFSTPSEPGMDAKQQETKSKRQRKSLNNKR